MHNNKIQSSSIMLIFCLDLHMLWSGNLFRCFRKNTTDINYKYLPLSNSCSLCILLQNKYISQVCYQFQFCAAYTPVSVDNETILYCALAGCAMLLCDPLMFSISIRKITLCGIVSIKLFILSDVR